MFRKGILLLVTVLGSTLWGCTNVGASTSPVTIVQTPVRTVTANVPAKATLQPVTSTLVTVPTRVVDDFECWSAPAPRNLETGTVDQFIVAYGGADDSQYLYRYDFSALTYTLMISQVAEYEPPGKNPFISPSHEYLYFDRHRSLEKEEVFLLRFSNQATLRAAFGEPIGGQVLIWTADGQCLVTFSSKDEGMIAYRIADGAFQRRPVVLRYPSPGGRWWAVDCEGRICMRDVAGNQILSEALRLPAKTDAEGHDYRTGSIKWSPNGRMLAFAYSTKHFLYQDMLRIVHFEQDSIAGFQDVQMQSISDLQWSPDGKRILIADANGESLHIYDVVQKTLFQIPMPSHYSTVVPPIWSPTGDQIAFVTVDRQSIYIMNADGAIVAQLPPLPTEVGRLGSHSNLTQMLWIP